jgi:hypothetical protein
MDSFAATVQGAWKIALVLCFAFSACACAAERPGSRGPDLLSFDRAGLAPQEQAFADPAPLVAETILTAPEPVSMLELPKVEVTKEPPSFSASLRKQGSITPGHIQTARSGDVVEIDVRNEPDLSCRCRVDGAGTIEVPLIGSIKVAGFSAAKIQKLVRVRLLDGYLKEPVVAVSLRYSSSGKGGKK